MAKYQHAQMCERRFGEQKCPFHPANNVVSFCEECSNLVCLNCMTSHDHRGHSFQNLDDIVKKKINDIFRFMHNVNKSFQPKISKNIADLDIAKSDFEKRKASILKDISTEYEKRVQQLKTKKKAMESDVNKLYDRNCKRCDLQKNAMGVLNKKLEGYSKQFQQIIDEGSLVEKFDAWKSIPLKEKEANSELDKSEFETFELVLDQHKVNELMKIALGKIKVYENSNVTKKESKVKVTRPPKHAQNISTATSFTNKSPEYNDLVPIAEDQAWCTTTHNENKIYLINKEGTIKKKLPLKRATISCLCLHPVTGVLYGTFHDHTTCNSICTIDTTTGSTTSVLNCSNVPGKFTVTPNGDIIVGGYSPGYVYRYSSKGQLLHKSKTIYTDCDISYSNINHHVAIAGGAEGVTIMDGTLTNEIHTHMLMCLTLAYDRDGSLVIGDSLNKSIKVLDGQTFSTIRTFRHPQMSMPMFIRIHDNSMWMKCGADKIVHVMFN